MSRIFSLNVRNFKLRGKEKKNAFASAPFASRRAGAGCVECGVNVEAAA